MRRLVSGLGYVFFGLFLVGWLVSDDEPTSKEFSKAKIDQPLLALSNDKAGLLTDVARPVALGRAEDDTLQRSGALKVPQYLYVTATRLNVRRGPAQSNARIGVLSHGAKVAVIEQRGGWTRINGARDGTQLSGWVSSKYVSATAPRAAPKTEKTRVRAVATPSNRDITQARKAIIRQSIAAYPGNCPCDYNRDRAGHRCGKRSAWSRRGGYAPLCYESDVTQAHLQSYFARQR
ncbi:SH3 domain-containing protein [Planktotalea sp.]|uniref:SH3 domain-containing protein n=1 Tax=Planktotalea sp. TaxID=2029877 RepID=UPI003D6A59EA